MGVKSKSQGLSVVAKSWLCRQLLQVFIDALLLFLNSELQDSMVSFKKSFRADN